MTISNSNMGKTSTLVGQSYMHMGNGKVHKALGEAQNAMKIFVEIVVKLGSTYMEKITQKLVGARAQVRLKGLWDQVQSQDYMIMVMWP